MGKKNSKIQQETVPSLAQYLAQRAQQVRDSAALELQQQEAPDVPVLPRTSDNTIAYWDAKLGTPDSTLIERYGVEPNPETCIYTVTTKYGDKDAAFTGNKTFKDEYNKHGYVKIPNDSSSTGDLVQLNQLFGLPLVGRPYHAIMQTSTSEEGTPLFSYSRGDITPYVVENGREIATMQKDRPLKNIKGRADSYTTYRYVGSPSKREEWTNEYNNKYGTQRSNGRLGVTARWSEGGPLKEHSAWDSLSMAEKAEMIGVAVKNGITTLPEIRAKYNEFAEGGDAKHPITTGGAGYIPSTPNIKKAAKGIATDIRQRLYDNIIPYGYHNPVGRTFSALVLNKPSEFEEVPKSGNVDALDELWAEYLQIPKDKRHYDPTLKKSKYKPTKATDNNATYYALPLDDEERQYIVNKARYGETEGLNPELGRYKIDLGEDENGKYASYYDSWDINPFRGTTAVGGTVSRFLGLNKPEDISMGIGKPVEVYDRIYFNSSGQAEPSKQVVLPEVVITGRKHSIGGNLFAKGGTTDADLVDWIIQEEGFNKKPEDIGDGKITLGSGLTSSKWHDLYKKRGNKWSAADNRRAVTEEVANRRRWAESNIPNWDTLPESSQKALLSYKYNYDFNRANSPLLFKALEKGNLHEAAKQMDATSKNPKFKKGLQSRRQREQNWFLSDVPPKTMTPNPLFEQPVSTAVFNPYIQQLENTRVAPIMIPDEDSYVTAHRLTEAENRKRKFQERMDAYNRFNRLLQLTSVENTAVPAFMPTTGNTFLDNIIGLTRADGGNIHIKPSHRGRLTELKARTGKTEAELYNDGNPAHKKMVVFARNSRRWKHGLGGNLFYEGGNDNPMNYDYRGTIFDDELKRQGITHIAELPEITVTGRDRTKPYRSSFDGSIQPYVEYFGALSHGLQPLSLSQHVGAIADAIQGKRNYFDSLFNGNSGFFSDEYAAEHPWVSTLGNMAGDVLIPTSPYIAKSASAFASAAKANQGFALSTPYMGKPLGKMTVWIPTDRNPLKGISWMSTGKPVEEGLPLNYITSKYSGEGRKLYDVGINLAHRQGSEGLLVGDELLSAPKSYSTYEHYYPNRIHVDDQGFWTNRNMLSDPKAKSRNVYSLEDFLKETKEHPDEKIIFSGAPRYRLETPSAAEGSVSRTAPGITAENDVYRAAYPSIRYDMPSNDAIIESSISANPNIPFDEAWLAASKGRHQMSNLVGSSDYAGRVRQAYQDNGIPVNQADFEILQAKQGIEDSNLKVVPNLKNANGEILNGQYDPNTGQILVSQNRENILDVVESSGHEHAHASEVERLLGLLKEKWKHIKPRKEAFTRSDGSIDTEWKDYISKIVEMRAPAMSVWSEMKELGFSKVGDYLQHLKRFGLEDKQWEALVNRYGLTNAKYMVETVFGLSPFVINRSDNEEKDSTTM